MFKKIDHIGIAVKSLDESIPLYRDAYGMHLHVVEEVPEQKVKVAMFEIGDIHIELLEPTSDDSPIAKFLEKKGPGMHHICYEVDDVDGTLEEVSAHDVQLIDKKSRIGAGGKKVAFLHPKSTGSVLTELNASS
jgi:methylmalonyl-CoA/ethylmalonyl-CoA epimerase